MVGPIDPVRAALIHRRVVETFRTRAGANHAVSTGSTVGRLQRRATTQWRSSSYARMIPCGEQRGRGWSSHNGVPLDERRGDAVAAARLDDLRVSFDAPRA